MQAEWSFPDFQTNRLCQCKDILISAEFVYNAWLCARTNVFAPSAKRYGGKQS